MICEDGFPISWAYTEVENRDACVSPRPALLQRTGEVAAPFARISGTVAGQESLTTAEKYHS
jgi:hypothetical protein